MKMNRKSFLQLLAGLLSGTTAINKSQAETWKPIIVDPSDPELPPEPLLSWLAQPRIPILQSEDPFIGWLIAATFTRQKVEFIYHGGSTPGQTRVVSPGMVFCFDEWSPVYVSAFCHQRQEERVFRVDRMVPAFVLN